MPEVGPPRVILPSALENQFKPSVRLLPQEDPYLARFQHGHPAWMIEPYSMLDQVVTSQQEWYRTEATHGPGLSNFMEHQGLPAEMTRIMLQKINGNTGMLPKILPTLCRTNIPGNLFLNFGEEY